MRKQHFKGTGRARGLLGFFCASAFFALTSFTLAFAPSSATAKVDFQQEPACSSDVPVSQGGPAPKSPDLLVVRWLGNTNEEFAYRDQVILMDAFYSAYAVPPGRPLGFGPQDVRKADVLLINHGHIDHVLDAPAISKRLGVKVVGAPVTGEILQKLGLPATQFVAVTGRGGEVLRYGPVTVEPFLSYHGNDDIPNLVQVQEAGNKALAAVQAVAGAARTAEAQAEFDRVRKLIFDPRLVSEGTIGYLLKFDGYKILFHGSGQITQYESALAATTGKVDLLINYYSFPAPNLAIDMSLPPVVLWKPTLLMPAHHDDVAGGRFDMAVEPYFEAVRAAVPGTRGISPLRKAPICIDVKTKEYVVGW